jgi:glutaredoxin 2
MTAALKRLHLQETVVLDDDTDTMVGLVGKRVIPILVKDDGQPMLESFDMVEYIDDLGEPALTGPERNEVAAWANGVVAKTAPLTMPRYPLLGLPEFGTIAALDHYNLRKREAFGDFTELRAHTRRYIKELMPDLEKLARLIERPAAVNGKLSLDDISRPATAPICCSREGASLPAKGARLLRSDDGADRLSTIADRIARILP